MRSRRSATLPCGATGETPVVPVCGRAGARPSRMGAAILVARDADERPINGGCRLRREDGFHADGVVNEFEEI